MALSLVYSFAGSLKVKYCPNIQSIVSQLPGSSPEKVLVSALLSLTLKRIKRCYVRNHYIVGNEESRKSNWVPIIPQLCISDEGCSANWFRWKHLQLY